MMVRVKLPLLMALVFALTGQFGCRTSLNADEFIANTLSNRTGEIRSALDTALPIAERTEAAQYLAAIEPIATEATRLVEEADSLQTTSRATSTALAERYGQLADRVQVLSVALGGLHPPAHLIAAHDAAVEAYRQQATVAAAFAKAFAKLDFPALRQLSVNQASASQSIALAHERLARDASSFFQPGKPYTLPPRIPTPKSN